RLPVALAASVAGLAGLPVALAASVAGLLPVRLTASVAGLAGLPVALAAAVAGLAGLPLGVAVAGLALARSSLVVYGRAGRGLALVVDRRPGTCRNGPVSSRGPGADGLSGGRGGR